MLAMLTQTPSLAITNDEGEKLADAMQNVLRHYDVPQVDEKIMDHVNLGIILVGVYGTRIAAGVLNKRAAQSAPATNETVINGAPTVSDIYAPLDSNGRPLPQ